MSLNLKIFMFFRKNEIFATAVALRANEATKFLALKTSSKQVVKKFKRKNALAFRFNHLYLQVFKSIDLVRILETSNTYYVFLKFAGNKFEYSTERNSEIENLLANASLTYYFERSAIFTILDFKLSLETSVLESLIMGGDLLVLQFPSFAAYHKTILSCLDLELKPGSTINLTLCKELNIFIKCDGVAGVDFRSMYTPSLSREAILTELSAMLVESSLKLTTNLKDVSSNVILPISSVLAPVRVLS